MRRRLRFLIRPNCQEVIPSGPPRTTTQVAAAPPDRPRSRGASILDSNSSAANGTRARPAPLYPTPKSTRKSGSSNTPVANLKLAAPDFGDQTSLGQSVLPESDEERQVEDRSSEQGEEGDGEESSSGSESGSGSECEESMDTRSSLIPKKKSMQNLSKTELEGKVARLKAEIARREASCEPVRGTTAPVILSMSSSKRGPKVTVKIEEGVSSIVEEEEGTRLQKEALGRIVGRHVREVVLGMCSITHANSVNIELLHDEDGAPVYWDANKFLRPHYNRPFDENFKAWGEDFYDIVTDESRNLETRLV
ncbi:hypothetical protein RhiJN_03699 [Ceratobasidium sp. AG-Ba]|nr:hypothetical protein RhiJN_03699 [Ceratobasidium sp. AG-Ba]